MKKLLFLIILNCSFIVFSQNDTIQPKLSFNSDFRFRIEHDWNSQRSDGTFRGDRTRLRYRFRAGGIFKDKWYETGFRIRTGNPIKQQDPQLTLGSGFQEFGTLPIGLEKVYFQGEWTKFKFWIGKNAYPFKKNNELFWSDNVYPEGVYLSKMIRFDSEKVDSIVISAAHFIMNSAGKNLGNDSYFQGIQSYISLFNQGVELFPSFYLFKNIPNIPDGNETFIVDYAMFHIGSELNLIKKKPLSVELDYYNNIINYSSNDSIPADLKNQKTSFVFGLSYGKLKEKGDLLFKASYAYLEKYSAVDFMAQNDWARWDYSSFGSPDGRLTNFNGIELVAGVMIAKRISLKMKYYSVKQLIPYGTHKESGNRIRLDIDIKF